MLIDPTRAILPSFVIAAALALVLHTLAVRFRHAIDGDDPSATADVSRGWERFALSLSLGVAGFVGVNLLRETFSQPEKYWETLAIIAIVVGALGPVVSAVSFRWKLVGWVVIGIVVAWFLVPTWSTLQPTRQVYVPLLAIYLASLGLLYGWGGNNASPREFQFTLCTTAATLAAATAATASLKYGELTAIVFASLAAFFVVNWFVRFHQNAIVGMLPAVATMMGGVAFVGYIYPQPPIYELTLLPFAPVGLLVARRFFDEETVRGTAIRIGGFLVILLPILASLFV